MLPVIKQTILTFFSEILNLEGHLNHCIGSKVTAILQFWVDLRTGVVASGRVCPAACAAGLYYDRFPLPLNIGVATGQFGTSEEYTMTFRAGPTMSEPPTREYWASLLATDRGKDYLMYVLNCTEHWTLGCPKILDFYITSIIFEGILF